MRVAYSSGMWSRQGEVGEVRRMEQSFSWGWTASRVSMGLMTAL
jgi:hypothetical protein